ncbi:MAG: ABC transporter ATP-binding protein [Blautia sp.]|nr:ABC transporter ATP-binding protein [Blautia sp.]
MSTCIEVNEMTKSFCGRTVVNGLSFSVETGEVFGLLGHNGAGKSTTIDLMLGLKKPDKGTARIFGMNPRNHRKAVFERVGVQLQSSHYQNNIRVDELCKQMAALYRDPEDYRKLLVFFSLEKLEKSQVNKLSGGEKQRLSVALALINKPEIVFLDELTTGLDTAARREVWRHLKELKKRGTTIFLTTHYMEEAESLCDRVFLIKEGKKVIEGTVQEIIEKSPYDNLEDAYLWYMGEEVAQ